jgi:hypothetical protein
MAWKWYDINSYKASVGGSYYYAMLQLYGDGFYAHFRFPKEGASPTPSATRKDDDSERFYSQMDYQQMQMMIDLLRNESPVRFGWNQENPDLFHLMTGKEPVGDGDGTLAEDAQ